MLDWLLLIFPVGIMVVLLLHAGVSKKGEYSDEAWGLGQAKAMQAFAALMIILHHLVQAITDYGADPRGPITIWNSFGILFTSFFFFFSGFGLYKSYKTKEGYLDHFFKKRMPKILIPYMVTNIIYLCMGSYGRIYELRHVFTSLFGITLLNTNAWFIVELIILYIAFYFCFKKSKSERSALTKLTTFAILLVTLGLFLGHDSSTVNGHWFMGEWWYNTTLIFIMGILIAKYEERMKNVMTKRYRILLPAATVLFIGWFLLEEVVLHNYGYYQEWKYHPGYPEKFFTLVMQIVLCAIFMFLLLLVNLKVTYRNKMLTFLGGISLELYLIHGVFQWVLYGGEWNRTQDILHIFYTYGLSITAAWGLAKVDALILDFCRKHSVLILSFKAPKFENGTSSIREQQAMLKKRSVVNALKIVIILAFTVMLITEGITLYQYIDRNVIQVNMEINLLKEASVGDRVYFGEWELDYEKGEMEPVPWLVADKEDGHILLISEYVLNSTTYHKTGTLSEWKDSELCRRMNYDFYTYGLKEKERELVCGKKGEGNENWDITDREAFTYYIHRTEKEEYEDIIVKNDLIFLPTKDDVLRYMPEAEQRVTETTKAARDDGLGWTKNGYVAPWWLADVADGEPNAMYVDIYGEIHEEGKSFYKTNMGVRPAMWLKLD